MIKKAYASYLESPTTQFTSIASIVNAFVSPILMLAGIVLFGLVVVGGFKYMTSGDDPKAKDGAKGTITSALIGFIIVFGAYWIIEIISTVIGLDIAILTQPAVTP